MSTRREFLRTMGRGAFALAMAGSLPAAAARKEEKRPNILFFLTDDQRNDTLGCAGHPIVKTPVIDSLARNGVRFENMFVTTSICAASRASLFTGLHERTHGYTFGKPPVPEALAQSSYPRVLREAGYRTGFTGKYGVKMAVPPDQLFDYFKPINRNPYFHKQPDGGKRHETDLCADRAIEFLSGQPKDKPFCLSVSFNASHAEDSDKRPGVGHYPWPPSTDGMYDDVKIAPPRLDDSAIFENQPEFLRESMNRIRYFWRWDTPEKYETNMRAYFRMLSGIDNAIGRVLKVLEERGELDNTVIIYSGDNGYYMGDRGFAGKWSHYEQSLRVPLIVSDPRLPKRKRNRVVDDITLNIDIPATMLDVAGIERPAVYQGKSVLPLTRRSWWRMHGRKDFFCEHLMEHQDIPKWEGIRGKRYVYARYFGQKPAYEFVHDLKRDPDQLKNLAKDPDYAKVLARLRKRTDKLKAEYAQP